MATKHRETQKRSKQPANTKAHAASGDQKVLNADGIRPDRTAGQNDAFDQKRNDEQQYHAGGAAHDPHNATQERIDRGDPDAGDVDEVSREDSAPYNKTYGHHG